ncbi:MAG TPA: ABC transporter permease [Vicinamibacterales bacterium]|nr:ABC transporter permease [Vicinamibacterales bacterium]
MPMFSDLWFRARALCRRRTIDAELTEELQAHLDAAARKYISAGLPPDAAARRARLEFGGAEQVREACVEARGVALVETLVHDARHAARLFRKAPAFSLAISLTAALGIGSVTAVFSVVNVVLLKPLPYRDAGRIVFPWRVPPPTVDVGFAEIPWGRAEFLTFSRQTRTFEHLGAFLSDAFNLTGAGEPVRFDGIRVSAEFFPALGVSPQHGRVFAPGEDQAGHEQVAILSDRTWRDYFSADPAIVGRAVSLNGAPYTIIGIMPAGFSFPRASEMPAGFTFPSEPQLWVPIALPQGPPTRGEPSELAVIGRLHPGISLEQAQAELDVFAQQMDHQLPSAKGWFNTRVMPLRGQLTGEVRRPLLLLLAAVGVVLVIACANIASLLLTRSVARAREFALRAALGAGRGRIARQCITESLLLSMVGGAAGLALGAAAVHALRAFGPADVPGLASARVDRAVFACAIAVTAFTGLACGTAPVVTSRSTVSPGDSPLRVTGGARSARLRNALLAAEVALALVLVIASGLLVRTFAHLIAADGGFAPDHALTFELTLPPARYADPDHIVRLYSDALDRLRATPGVQSVGLSETIPLGGAGESTALRIPGRPVTGEDVRPFANYTIVSPGYLSAIGATLLRGRDILETDSATSVPVALVNVAMANRYWPGQDAVGKRVGVPIRNFDMTVVGVVANVKRQSFREDTGPEIYVPYTQKPWPSMLTMHAAVRTAGDAGAMTGLIRATIRSVDPELPIANVAPLSTIVDRTMAHPRFSMMLVTMFGALALMLACVGLYGAVSYSASQRTREIGIRIALGARPSRVLGLMLGQGLRVAATGIAIGLVVAVGVSRTLAHFLYGVTPTDAATYVAVSVLLCAVALAACYVPAKRAAGIDPLGALRQE